MKRKQSMPEAAWNWRMKRLQKNKGVGLERTIEEAFVSGAKWQKRRSGNSDES